MSPYRILSMDGGGIRGLLMAILLERLEAAVPGFLKKFDLFAGTSTGGLLALGLAADKHPSEARQLYEKYGSKVFRDTIMDDIRDLSKLVGADYQTAPLREALQDLFGELRLGDLHNKVLVSAFDLDNGLLEPGQTRTWKAKFFHNYPGEDSDADQRVVDVALYTSAAPSYFPTVDGFVDGGVVANNPSMCALAQALHPLTGGQNIEDVVMLSLGTGHNPRFLEAQNADWGLVQWAPVLVNLVMEGSANLADYQCRQLLGDRYLRLNPVLPRPISMDRVDQIPVLWRIAAQFDLDEAVLWILKFFK